MTPPSLLSRSAISVACGLLALQVLSGCSQGLSPSASPEQVAEEWIDAVARQDADLIDRLSSGQLDGEVLKGGILYYDVRRTTPVQRRGDLYVATVAGTYREPTWDESRQVELDVEVRLALEGSDWVVTFYTWGAPTN